MTGSVLVSRLDNAGDVLLTGPAVRAAAAGSRVTFLCGPRGEAAARMLPGVADVIVWDAPWVGFDPPPVDAVAVRSLVADLADRRFDAAALLTSFHQSPLPLALLLRLADVPEIAAVSVDYPGSLLDHRLPYREELHEVEQSLEVTSALGFPAPSDHRLALRSLATPSGVPAEPYVVVHPGASVPARSLPGALVADLLADLDHREIRTVVTGSETERADAPLRTSSPLVHDLRGRTTFAELAGVIAGASALVAGNTGPAHLAAATGTPVVSVFAPVVPVHRWRPWQVPTVVFGRQDIPCAGCRSRVCPFETQDCVTGARATDVVTALVELAGMTSLEKVAR